MGVCDQLFQHLALDQAVVVCLWFECKMGDKAHFDVQVCAHPVAATACAVLSLVLCVGLGHVEPPRYCVTTRMIN
ncbi:hypothetical protein [Serratia fonticola]